MYEQHNNKQLYRHCSQRRESGDIETFDGFFYQCQINRKMGFLQQQITDISGKFGIAHTEDWSLAEGFLEISEETVTGSIDGHFH